MRAHAFIEFVGGCLVVAERCRFWQPEGAADHLGESHCVGEFDTLVDMVEEFAGAEVTTGALKACVGDRAADVGGFHIREEAEADALVACRGAEFDEFIAIAGHCL